PISRHQQRRWPPGIGVPHAQHFPGPLKVELFDPRIDQNTKAHGRLLRAGEAALGAATGTPSNCMAAATWASIRSDRRRPFLGRYQTLEYWSTASTLKVVTRVLATTNSPLATPSSISSRNTCTRARWRRRKA